MVVDRAKFFIGDKTVDPGPKNLPTHGGREAGGVTSVHQKDGIAGDDLPGDIVVPERKPSRRNSGCRPDERVPINLGKQEIVDRLKGAIGVAKALQPSRCQEGPHFALIVVVQVATAKCRGIKRGAPEKPPDVVMRPIRQYDTEIDCIGDWVERDFPRGNCDRLSVPKDQSGSCALKRGPAAV